MYSSAFTGVFVALLLTGCDRVAPTPHSTKSTPHPTPQPTPLPTTLPTASPTQQPTPQPTTLPTTLPTTQPVPPPAANGTFVPLCIAEKCGAEAKALVTDDYATTLASCAATRFGPCADKAWACLGDASCRAAVACAPKVFKTCQADLWHMVQDPAERQKLTCLADCYQDGSISTWCAVKNCGKASLQCLFDKTCRASVECVPRTVLSCSKAAFGCVFAKSGVCRDNLKCVGSGMVACGPPALNLATDMHIADFVECAGKQCPAPAATIAPSTPEASGDVQLFGGPITGAVGELACLTAHCTASGLKVLMDDDTKGLVTCALQNNLPQLCSSAWGCLGDANCTAALQCWTEPLDACVEDVWHVLTDAAQRTRIQHGLQCVQECEAAHAHDFTQGALCVLDRCGQDLLDCRADAGCWAAVQCLPREAACWAPTLDAYLHQPLFHASAQCLATGLESCGRAAVEMLRDQHIAEAVRCAAQCTKPPADTLTLV